MNITDIIIANVMTYVTISFVALVMGYVVAKSKTIGYILIFSVLTFCIYIVIAGMYEAVSNDVSIFADSQPLTLIGAFIGGLTIYYWYDAGSWLANN